MGQSLHGKIVSLGESKNNYIIIKAAWQVDSLYVTCLLMKLQEAQQTTSNLEMMNVWNASIFLLSSSNCFSDEINFSHCSQDQPEWKRKIQVIGR